MAEGIKIGKHGFVSHSRRNVRTINVEDLARLIPKRSEERPKGELPLVDLSGLGYGKLLGGGVLRQPVAVRVAKVSKSAASKIEAAGGKIVLPT